MKPNQIKAAPATGPGGGASMTKSNSVTSERFAKLGSRTARFKRRRSVNLLSALRAAKNVSLALEHDNRREVPPANGIAELYGDFRFNAGRLFFNLIDQTADLLRIFPLRKHASGILDKAGNAAQGADQGADIVDIHHNTPEQDNSKDIDEQNRRLVELNARIHAGIRYDEEKARRLIRDFPGRINLEAMFITLVGMWGFAHPGTLDEHLDWLRYVMEHDTNAVLHRLKAEALRTSNIVRLNKG